MPRALLLKTKSNPTDPYDEAFRQKTPLIPVFVPVLSHQQVNGRLLCEMLQKEPSKRYIALIVTSQRAVEALDDAMTILTGISLRALATYGRGTIARIESDDRVYCWTSYGIGPYQVTILDHCGSGHWQRSCLGQPSCSDIPPRRLRKHYTNGISTSTAAVVSGRR